MIFSMLSSLIICISFLRINQPLAMANPINAERSSNSFNSSHSEREFVQKSELVSNLYSMLNLKTQIQLDYLENESKTMELVNEFNNKYANFVKKLPDDLKAKSNFEKTLHKTEGKWEKIHFTNEIGIIENNLEIIIQLKNKMEQAIEHIEWAENVHEVVQYHLERVHSELFRQKHYKYKLLLLAKWDLPVSMQKLVNVFDLIKIIMTLCGFLLEVGLQQDIRSTVAKVMDQLKEVEQNLAQTMEIDQKLLKQMQTFGQTPNPWECQDEMQLMARLDHQQQVLLSHGQISLIYMHECAFLLASELGTLINELCEIGTEWTNADAIDEVLKRSAVLERQRRAVLKWECAQPGADDPAPAHGL